jgi:6-phosphofructokinase 1
LGLSKSELLAEKIVDNLVERKVNQVYLIGANKTLRACQKLYDEIKRRELSIAICVILKGINRDVPIFDTCFGFETAVEESSRILLCAYNLAKSYGNGVSLVKLPGIESGFLACYAALSSINVNICLVPEFPFDLHGDDGVIR